MGFHSVAELTHEMEDVLDKLRKDTLEVNEDIVNILFACVDSLEKMVEKMCHTPADLFRVEKRGYIRQGYFADLVLVNPSNPKQVIKIL